ncbi:FliM/FliN family flagellar motor switch protein [Trinickia caryophylli]|uniref:Type III secretion protein Q n=1 Tax=Trinickia caryophylli TaxID=28094 RepID=A0A1X7EWS1_TRICW|nr:FliM/FliN family flagellar motor switch protein [Trinickia caryophylli]PMS09698.1 YscQ/HrcQ family type III secretion apparatus protein [Trinickia caryophylli]TRX18469.1 YscQ/HrcQ family type III secretion apparatus protein [Trinickia caryophylli]WQE10744.1 FliM/FliN family flagellar motor switch protein [Trinickia caryophylli]SMF41309.1 type III secretion protein Q [Trinickia caryophylli]GLU33119.1 hypothetical protein Busp01_29610 [Trinickia caryophylli]
MIGLPRLDSHEARLLRKVGAGLRVETGEHALALGYRDAGGESGVTLCGMLEGAPVRLWVDARQWCGWLAPMLSVADVSQIPEALHPLLCAWTFETFGEALTASAHSEAAVPWPVGIDARRGRAGRRCGWWLASTYGERRLDARVLEAPLNWLEALADRLASASGDALAAGDAREAGEPPAVPRIRASLVAGWSGVPGTAAQNLRVGDALVLRRAYDVAQGEFALFCPAPLARIRRREAGAFSIEECMNEFDDWLDVEPAPVAAPAPGDEPGPASAPAGMPPMPLVRIVAEVGGLDLPVTELAALRPGDLLTGLASIDEWVTLRVGPRVIARATLLDIDGHLAARIETL